MPQTLPDKPNMLDWLGLVTILVQAGILGFSRTYTGAFHELFAQTGADPGLLTNVVLSPIYGALTALLIVLCGSALWWPSLRGKMSMKRGFLMTGFLLGMIAIALYVIGLYIPIFALPGNAATV